MPPTRHRRSSRSAVRYATSKKTLTPSLPPVASTPSGCSRGRHGLIVPGPDGQPASGQRIPGQPPARYYRFTPGVVSDDSDLSKNTVTTVTPVTSSNEAGSECNRAEKSPVTTVTPDGYDRKPVTAVTVTEAERLQKKDCDSSHVTDVTAVTAENDNSEQKNGPIIDMRRRLPSENSKRE